MSSERFFVRRVLYLSLNQRLIRTNRVHLRNKKKLFNSEKQKYMLQNIAAIEYKCEILSIQVINME